MSQLALPLRLADHAVFGSFLETGNETLVATLQDLADGGAGQGCWIWGGPATGKTHLLQAACDRAGDRSVYVPLAMLAPAGPELLEGLASRELICLDDIRRSMPIARSSWRRRCRHANAQTSCRICKAGSRGCPRSRSGH